MFVENQKNAAYVAAILLTFENLIYMGRPPTRPKKLRDGYYIEVRNKGSKTGIKIVRNSKEEMLKAIKDYSKTKEVVVLGESKNGKWVVQPK
ncbi:hypothetical protein MNBD_BACTEROID07-757 [hydrothermal vent metagenome]|uniref:Uncharacterized protein n=1 Tax=hydrothermal vent metagenome TaxID=652676 RepID=A0A3B0UUE6_9ZZZZ